MTTASFEIRLCQNSTCGLRYPLVDVQMYGNRCPACLGETNEVLKRTHLGQPSEVLEGSCKGIKAALLDNLRSAWNVGAIFRTADGLGVEKLYLCGITPTPDNKAVIKTSLSAEDSVAWEYSRNALETAQRLILEGKTLIALEQDQYAIPIEKAQHSIPLKNRILIVGNEVSGVDPELLDMCDIIVHIPMRGQKHSLNVEVAFGIAISQLNIY